MHFKLRFHTYDCLVTLLHSVTTRKDACSDIRKRTLWVNSLILLCCP